MNQPGIAVRVSHEYAADAPRVFAAWLDPQNAAHWLFATETGTVMRVEMDPRVGGNFTIVDRRDGEDVAHVGTYLEIDAPRRLAFTFQVPRYSDDVSTVAIDIEPLASGCRLTLVNTLDARSAEWADSTREGWTAILGGLGRNLGLAAQA